MKYFNINKIIHSYISNKVNFSPLNHIVDYIEINLFLDIVLLLFINILISVGNIYSTGLVIVIIFKWYILQKMTIELNNNINPKYYFARYTFLDLVSLFKVDFLRLRGDTTGIEMVNVYLIIIGLTFANIINYYIPFLGKFGSLMGVQKSTQTLGGVIFIFIGISIVVAPLVVSHHDSLVRKNKNGDDRR